MRQLEADPALQPWMLRAMALRGSRVMIGHIGFHAAPGAAYLQTYSPGGAEFGFEVFPAFRRQGYAREAYGLRRFVLSIRPDNIPSLALAAQLGFVRIGSHIDEVDGLEEILEHVAPENV